MPITERELLAAARRARRHARADISRFSVGAALEAGDGLIVTGCNIENATLGLTMCAERVALFKALSDGVRRFRRMAVVADTSMPTPPCGACRQLLWEFGGDLEIVLGNLRRTHGRHQLSALFPQPFDDAVLGIAGGKGPRRAPPRGR
jgi:cytidine deaminase